MYQYSGNNPCVFNNVSLLIPSYSWGYQFSLISWLVGKNTWNLVPNKINKSTVITGNLFWGWFAKD